MRSPQIARLLRCDADLAGYVAGASKHRERIGCAEGPRQADAVSTGSKSLDRPVHQWLSDIAAGKLHLASFQRGEAWDRRRIESMPRTIIRDLPLGITLVLDVGEKDQFHSRPLVTAPDTHAKVTEHSLNATRTSQSHPHGIAASTSLVKSTRSPKPWRAA